MYHMPHTLYYSQSSVKRRAAASRLRNDKSVKTDTLKEQIVSLKFQIDEKEQLFEDLKYAARLAKRAGNFEAMRGYETLWRHEKGLLKALTNNCNRICNRLLRGQKNPSQQRFAKAQQKTARLRARRLKHEALQAT